MILAEVFFVIGAYLLGSLPVLYWIGRARGFDLSRDEDLHQALWREVGYAEGLAGVLWDIFKGPLPPLLAWLFNFDTVVVGLSGLAVVAGQMWPIFTRFYGKERGNTTGLGTAVAIDPLSLGYALIPVAIGALMRVTSSMRKLEEKATKRLKFSGKSDSMPLGMLAAFLILPLAAWGLHEDAAIVWSFVGLFVLIVLRRLTADLKEDLGSDLHPNINSILKNRFLYDRSHH
jgi:glycerol-3-phosphate acyltransferase PlsY